MMLELASPLLIETDTVDNVCVDGRHLSPANHATAVGWLSYGTSLVEEWIRLTSVSALLIEFVDCELHYKRTP